MSTKQKRVTWSQRGAPGCGKCRHIGCRYCYERELKKNPELRAAATAGDVLPPPPTKRQKAVESDIHAITPSPKRARQTLTVEEIIADEEIDRLLHQANKDLRHYEGLLLPLDPKESLLLAKKMWGCGNLMKLLERKKCRVCTFKLGIYFHRMNEGGNTAAVCGSCFQSNPSSMGTWLPEQAEEVFRLPGLLRKSKGPQKGLGPLSIRTVSVDVVKSYGSIWELHYQLATNES